MRFGSVVFSIRNSIIGMRSQTSEVSSSVVYTATIAWSVGEAEKSTDTWTCAVSRGLSVGTWSKNFSVVMLLSWVAAVRASLEALLPLLEQKRDGTHLARARQHYAEARKALDELAVGTPGKRLIHPQQIAKAISDHAAEDAVFTCDVGLPTVWAARYLTMNGRRRLLGSFSHGSMANAMAQGIGAQAAFPGRQVISLSGDGGFTMLMGDFLTLAQHRLPLKVVVFTNGALGFVELEQKSTGSSISAPSSRTRTSRRWPKPSACAGSGSKTRLRWMRGLRPPWPMTDPFWSTRS
jgi:hypothetical protein